MSEPTTRPGPEDRTHICFVMARCELVPPGGFVGVTTLELAALKKYMVWLAPEHRNAVAKTAEFTIRGRKVGLVHATH